MTNASWCKIQFQNMTISPSDLEMPSLVVKAQIEAEVFICQVSLSWSVDRYWVVHFPLILWTFFWAFARYKDDHWADKRLKSRAPKNGLANLGKGWKTSEPSWKISLWKLRKYSWNISLVVGVLPFRSFLKVLFSVLSLDHVGKPGTIFIHRAWCTWPVT